MEAQQKNNFKKSERLYRKTAIQFLFLKCKSFRLGPLKIVFNTIHDETGPPVKVMFSVPKRLWRRAVDRNRLKRLMRECYRLQKNEFIAQLRPGNNKVLHVAFIYTGKTILPHRTLRQKISEALGRCISEYNKTSD